MYDRTLGWRYVARRPDIDLDLIRDPDWLANRTKAQDNGITLSVHIVYGDGRTVPFDPELLRP